MLKKRITGFFIYLTIFLVLIGLVVYPSQWVDAGRRGVELCLRVIVPSLFPFFVISSLSQSMGATDKLGKPLSFVLYPLFGVRGGAAAAMVLGLFGGYPVGAKCVGELYSAGGISKSSAEILSLNITLFF